MQSPLLGSMSVEEFMAEYWQKKPCIIRGAFAADALQILDANEIAGLALEEDIESRLIQSLPNNHSLSSVEWTSQLGPFDEKTLTKLPETNWTLLIQSVDIWLEPFQELLEWVDFIPRWRLDDIMISLATPGGGVGPHRDQYDVFLIQANGTRRWKVAPPSNTPDICVTDNLLQVSPFIATIDEEFQAGDILYLPPGWLHWGTAVTECITCSIGFRAPSAVNIIETLSQIIDDSDLKQTWDRLYRYTDLGRKPGTNMSIRASDVQQVREKLQQLLQNDRLLAEALASVTTQPKIYPQFDEALLDAMQYIEDIHSLPPEQEWILAPHTRMTYYVVDENIIDVYINGELFKIDAVDTLILDKIASHSPISIKKCLNIRQLINIMPILLKEGSAFLL